MMIGVSKDGDPEKQGEEETGRADSEQENWNVGGTCETRPAPVVAATIGPTTASPQTVVGEPRSVPISLIAKPMAATIPMNVPRIHMYESIRQAKLPSCGQWAGTIVAVAEPTERIPMDTVPHIGVWVESRSVIVSASRDRVTRMT